MKVNSNKYSETVFFCGAVLTHDGLKRYKGSAPAASNWTKGLMHGIENKDIKVNIFSSIWDSLFPKGQLFPGKIEYLDKSINQHLIKYINFPLIRSHSISYSIEKSITEFIIKGTIPIAILNYNPTKYYCTAIKKIKHKFPEIPWINIVLDFDDPERDNWKEYINLTEKADGHVFLSWWAYLNAPVKNKLHLDSGWGGDLPEYKKKQESNKVFLYAGKMADYGGIIDIINAIKQFPNPDVRFEFYGKDVNKELQNLSLIDKRIIIKGFVSDAELDEACLNADAFLAPCDKNWISSKMTFPSKILLYLKYQKPIISEVLPGLSPDYDDILFYPNNDSSWRDQIEKVYSLNDIQKETIAFKSRELLKNKTWGLQAQNLVNFIKGHS